MAKYALDKSPFPIDVALADASASDAPFVAELAHELTELGVSIIKACDSVGRYYPNEADAFFEELFRRF